MLTLTDNQQPIMSGAIHYFRLLKSDYKDRLMKLKACGFNTVETYVPWNLHEPEKGKFVFDGHFDIECFLQTAAELDLAVILRPGPYICSEWDFGGLPAWLLKDKNMVLRCYYEPYLKHVDDWFDAFIPRIVPYLSTNGGPIIGVQVENEYGSYGDDKKYLNHIKEGLIRRGVDVTLFTSDGGPDHMLTGGTLPDVYKTVNFGSAADWNFSQLRKRQPDLPVMCMEFWDGWFDHWEVPHHTRPSHEVVQVFEDMLAHNAHVNFYMFHGGTNFGFYNGANFYNDANAQGYGATATSYDYCALLTEAGDITETYLAIRECMEKHFGPIPYEIPANTTKKAYGKVNFTKQALLFDNLNNLTTKKESAMAENMEYYDQDFGYILYRTHVEGPRGDVGIHLTQIHDRAQIFINDEEIAVYKRGEKQELSRNIPSEGITLDILVENMGRINYGPQLKDYKGLVGGLTIAGCYHFGYDVYNLDMKDLSKLEFKDTIEKTNKPCFYQATFTVDEAHDTFLKFENLTKGFVLINGFNIGRYWNVGPQETLFVPSGLLKEGENEIVIFEQHEAKEPSIEFIDYAILG